MPHLPIKFEACTAWRIAAAVLWIVSIACLFKAVGEGAAAEKWLYNPDLSDAARKAIRDLQTTADHWATVGWILQFATATLLAAGTKSPRVVRRIFVSLGVLIAADGTILLLMALLVHQMR